MKLLIMIATILSGLSACSSRPQQLYYGGQPLTFEQRMMLENQRSEARQRAYRNAAELGSNHACQFGGVCPKAQGQQNQMPMPQRHNVFIFGQ